MVKRNDIPSLVARFGENVASQTDAMQRGDHKAGNVCARRYIAAFEELREAGDVGRAALVALFGHPRPDVRVMAAAYLLRYQTAEALEVLRQEAEGSGLVALEATEAIKRWEEGTWSLDPA